MNRTRTIASSALPILISLAFVGVGAARAVPAGAPGSDDDPAAVALLARAVDAAVSLSYSGTQFVGVWGAAGSGSAVVEVRQRAGGAREVRAVPASGLVARWNRTDVQVPVDAVAAGPALDVLAAAYRLRLRGSDTVAGRVATLVSADRDGRPAARLWLDRATGLLLRLEVLDGQGRLVRSSGYVRLDVEAPAVAPAAIRLAAASGPQLLGGDAMARLTAQGRPTPPDLPGGFRLHDSRRTGDLLHLTYTDGLSGVSVFLQRGRLDASGLTGFTAERWGERTVHVGRGWPLRVVWQDGAEVATLVADAPEDRVRAIVAGFPAGTPDDAGARLGDRIRAMLRALPGR